MRRCQRIVAQYGIILFIGVGLMHVAGVCLHGKEIVLFSSWRDRGVRTLLSRMKPNASNRQNRSTATSMSLSKECGCWIEDPKYLSEVERRASQRYLALTGGEEELKAQRLFDQLGSDLKEARQNQKRSIENVAQAIEIEPAFLCFLERGWATKDEFMGVLDRWVTTLSQDINEYHTRISDLVSQQNNEEEK